MRNVLFAASALAALAIASPAMAQNEDKPFNGPRVEGVVGWDRVSDDSIYGAKKDGVVGGVAAGYDFQAGHVVFGVEGEGTIASTKDQDSGVLVAGDSLRVKAGRDLYAGGRIGFTLGNNALLYAKGGYTNARINEHYTAPGTPGINISDHDDLDGWRAGAGVEVKLGGKVYAKAEYRYSDYSSDSGLGLDVKRNQVVGGLGVRF
jgi:outer membrane immunogenic protein